MSFSRRGRAPGARVMLGVGIALTAALLVPALPAMAIEPRPPAPGGDGAPPSTRDPSIDYILHCRGCHGAEGAGASGAVPSFRGQVAQFLGVEGGREYLVRVPGTSQSELDDARIAALLNWLVREFDPGHVPPEAAPYSEAEIRRVRRPPLVDVEGMRRQLLQEIEARARP